MSYETPISIPDLEVGEDGVSATLSFGGACCLLANHVSPCECAGDMPGLPWSCPA